MRRRVRLVFSPQLITEPVIYELSRDFQIVTNVRRADVSSDRGWVLLEISGEADELVRGIAYLEGRGVTVEPVEGDLVQ